MIVEKEAVSVAEMARMVGLSRARFYQLVGSTFPHPIYDVATRRPFYTRELQEICLDVRRRQCGINGRPVLFYARRMVIAPAMPKRGVKKPVVANDQYDDLLDGLRALGLLDVTAAQVSAPRRPPSRQIEVDPVARFVTDRDLGWSAAFGGGANSIFTALLVGSRLSHAQRCAYWGIILAGFRDVSAGAGYEFGYDLGIKTTRNRIQRIKTPTKTRGILVYRYVMIVCGR